MKIIKKILGVLCGCMAITGIYTLAVTNISITGIILVVIFASLTFLCFRRTSKTQPVIVEPVQQYVQNNQTEYHSSQQIPTEAIENSRRIANESIQIMKKTKDVDTLCERYEIGLRNCYTLKQAGCDDAEQLIQAFTDCYHPLIKNCYQQSLSEVKTEKGKKVRRDKFISELSKYLDEYTLNDLIKEL